MNGSQIWASTEHAVRNATLSPALTLRILFSVTSGGVSTSDFLGVHYCWSPIYVNIKSLTRRGRVSRWQNLQRLRLFHSHPNEPWSMGFWLLEARKQSQAWPYPELYVTAPSQLQWQEMCWAKNILSRCKSGAVTVTHPGFAVCSTPSAPPPMHSRHNPRQPQCSIQTICVRVLLAHLEMVWWRTPLYPPSTMAPGSH